MTFEQKLDALGKRISKRFKDDIEDILVFVNDDKESPDFGSLNVEFYEWGGPKMKNGKIVGDYDASIAISEFEKGMAPLGMKLARVGEGDDIEHHKIYCYKAVFT